MGPRGRALLQISLLIAVLVLLAVLFPPVLAFVERGARELRYFWWAILLALLGIWLVWGVGKKRPG